MCEAVNSDRALLRREIFTLRDLEDGRTSVHEKPRLVIDKKTRNWNRQRGKEDNETERERQRHQ